MNLIHVLISILHWLGLFMLLLFWALGTAVKALQIFFCFAHSLITSEKNSDFVVCGLHHGIMRRRRIHRLRVKNFLWMRHQTSVQTLMEQAIAFVFIHWIILLKLHTCFASVLLVVGKCAAIVLKRAFQPVHKLGGGVHVHDPISDKKSHLPHPFSDVASKIHALFPTFPLRNYVIIT